MKPLPDIIGDNAAHPLNAAGGNAACIQIIVTGTGTVRLGDATVTSSLGLPIPAGGGQFLPVMSSTKWYSLNGTWVYVPAGATVSAAYV
jgi:hypothetical protein